MLTSFGLLSEFWTVGWTGLGWVTFALLLLWGIVVLRIGRGVEWLGKTLDMESEYWRVERNFINRLLTRFRISITVREGKASVASWM